MHSLINADSYNSYFVFNPQIKYGIEPDQKSGSQTSFMEVVFGKFNYRFDDKFSISGGASVGFTGKKQVFKLNHFNNNLSLKSNYYILKNTSVFIEGVWAPLIQGSNNPVGHFKQGNFQSIGVELIGLTIFDIIYRYPEPAIKKPKSFIVYGSRLKLGKQENGNFFTEFMLAEVDFKINPYISFAGDASAGCTAPRGAFKEWGLYSSRLRGRFTWRPKMGVGYFTEVSIAKKNKNNKNYSTYFQDQTYILLGVEMKAFTFLKKGVNDEV